MEKAAGSELQCDMAQELAARLKAFIRSKAEELLALPDDLREAHYRGVHAGAVELALEHGRSDNEGEAWALKIVLLTRAMVRTLEEQALSLAGFASDLEAALEADEAEVGEERPDIAATAPARL